MRPQSKDTILSKLYITSPWNVAVDQCKISRSTHTPISTLTHPSRAGHIGYIRHEVLSFVRMGLSFQKSSSTPIAILRPSYYMQLPYQYQISLLVSFYTRKKDIVLGHTHAFSSFNHRANWSKQKAINVHQCPMTRLLLLFDHREGLVDIKGHVWDEVKEVRWQLKPWTSSLCNKLNSFQHSLRMLLNVIIFVQSSNHDIHNLY